MSTAFVDFAALKQQVTIVQVAHMLGLKLVTKGPQSRGPCTACNQGGDRTLAVNSDKASFYCFAAKAGGDCIALVAHIRAMSQRDAANLIANHFRFAGGTRDTSEQSTSSQTSRTAPPAPQKPRFDAEAYLRALEPASELLQPLGISPETLQNFGAGYCKSGVLRGKLAIALRDRDGNTHGFAGRALDSPQLTFPNGVNAADFIFGQDKLQEGEARLLRDPLEVMQAHEVGETAVCFLTDTLEPQQLEQMASLLDQKKCRLFL